MVSLVALEWIVRGVANVAPQGTHNSQSTAVRSIARSVMATDASAEQEDTRAAAFEALAATAGVDMQLKLRASGPPRFSGLFTPKAAKRGQVHHTSCAVNMAICVVAVKPDGDTDCRIIFDVATTGPHAHPGSRMLGCGLRRRDQASE